MIVLIPIEIIGIRYARFKAPLTHFKRGGYLCIPPVLISFFCGFDEVHECIKNCLFCPLFIAKKWRILKTRNSGAILRVLRALFDITRYYVHSRVVTLRPAPRVHDLAPRPCLASNAPILRCTRFLRSGGYHTRPRVYAALYRPRTIYVRVVIHV